ncbi:hypothetical protein KC19_4G161300 [Ceratodon purpureus]|uniref:Secreted protein n=1 Tax=Ceratodon purpureus TaxID=3225 RepID=A0A8T0I9B3_CERPU|nr:hypothetical protein KC19_4G161300 [Ceratodon purpureus]
MPSQFFLRSFHFLTIWVGKWVTADAVFSPVGCLSGFNSLAKCFGHYQSMLCWRIRFPCRCSVFITGAQPVGLQFRRNYWQRAGVGLLRISSTWKIV